MKCFLSIFMIKQFKSKFWIRFRNRLHWSIICIVMLKCWIHSCALLTMTSLWNFIIEFDCEARVMKFFLNEMIWVESVMSLTRVFRVDFFSIKDMISSNDLLIVLEFDLFFLFVILIEDWSDSVIEKKLKIRRFVIEKWSWFRRLLNSIENCLFDDWDSIESVASASKMNS